MHKFTLFKSKRAVADDDSQASASSMKLSTVRKVSGKLAKKVRRQIWRLDEMLHHVTHTKHNPDSPKSKGKQQRAAISSPPIITSLDVQSFSPSSSRSTRSRDTWNEKYVREVDLHSIERASTVSSVHSTQHLPSSADAEPPPAIMTEEQRQEPSLPDIPAEEVDDADDEDHSDAEPMFTSPPTVYIEAETPDPFLIDEEGDELSAGEEQEESSAAVSPADNVPLDLPPQQEQESEQLPPQPPKSPLPNMNKDVPPPPSSESEQEEDELPDIYVPALVVPTMFLPIPNTDPLTTLLNKYIYPPEKRPPRDLTGEWQRSDFHTLVMTNSWRGLARMARDRIVTSDPSDLTLVLGLWHLRLSCLARLRLFNQTSAECTNLFSVLNSLEPAETRQYVFERILPFELEVMQTRLKYWAGDHMGYLDALSALLKKCRTKCRQAGGDATLVPMWKERGARVCLILASQMVEMKEMTAAAKLLEPLCAQGDVSSPALRSSVARIYLQGGNLRMGSKHLALVEADPDADDALKAMNTALLRSAEGEWAEASEALSAILEKDADNFVAVNNLSVALLSQGKLKESIEVLEKALKASPSSVVVAEPFLFNLSTLYELRSTIGLEKKKDLLVDVAKWSGDGLRATCLKMPAN